MKIVLYKNAVLPSRAHTWDAGLDLFTPVDVVVPGSKIRMGFRELLRYLIKGRSVPIDIGSVTIDTGVHMDIAKGRTGFIKSKSGLNVNFGLTAEGVIDAEYTGSIKVKLYNHSRYPHRFRAGDKIAQIVILPCVIPSLEVVDKLNATERGNGGFGSTGR